MPEYSDCGKGAGGGGGTKERKVENHKINR